MAKQRVYTVQVVRIVYLSCPHCQEALDNPGGSAGFIVEDEWEDAPQEITCLACGKTFCKPQRNPFERKRR